MEFMSEFNKRVVLKNAMLAGIQPWLFYSGRGMQKDNNRRIQYSRQQWINLWAYQYNRKFAHDFFLSDLQNLHLGVF